MLAMHHVEQSVLAAGATVLAVEQRAIAKARRELGWELRNPSWRQGFTELLA